MRFVLAVFVVLCSVALGAALGGLASAGVIASGGGEVLGLACSCLTSLLCGVLGGISAYCIVESDQ